MPLFLGPSTCITICQKAEKKKISIRILLLFKKILNIINDTTTQHIDFFSRERDSFWEIQLSLDLYTNWFRTCTSMNIFRYLNFLHHRMGVPRNIHLIAIFSQKKKYCATLSTFCQNPGNLSLFVYI